MLEIPERLNYAEWDSEGFSVPPELILGENAELADALNVFYKAGGYDFFKVINPEKYATAWVEFVGGLYADIEDGRYVQGGKRFVFPFSEDIRKELEKQGVPERFTSDF